MDSCGLICEKFVKLISRKDIGMNEMTLPSDFCSKYINRLPGSFHLILRTGYRLPVFFNKGRLILNGVYCLFRDFGLKGGEMLLFEYFGREDINVYIIGINGSEVEYPHVIHHLQTCHPRRVTVGNGGWRFALFVDATFGFHDDIEAPITFMERRGYDFTVSLRIVLSNGKVFWAKFTLETRKISCLRRMSEVLGVPDLKCFHMLLFTYDGVSAINVSAFDEHLYETVFPGSPLCNGVRASGFALTIKQSNMLPDYYGVDISSDYQDICNMWGRIDYIHVYDNNCSWRLEVRKRSDWKGTYIHDGWLEFRNSLELDVDDLCIFQFCRESYNHFTVRVIKNPGDDH
ncbi:TF-B3 domain-containing protein [Heracleum sosnowskyi]|uniref:TF-B3 domain-containing protein n=1 Tax=Heracleum sosnowskyi TaxID=360622 RepID=A0AAD8MCP5_9APIA|nr:TF-B3 domain-containing protein [Heracleum sosnowskyi]